MPAPRSVLVMHADVIDDIVRIAIRDSV